MKRGDIVRVRRPGTPEDKARPCVVVQRESALVKTAKVTVCPLTSRLRGAEGQRPFVAPAAVTGLNVPSEVEVDWILTYPRDHLDQIIGHLDAATMDTVDAALRRWLDV